MIEFTENLRYEYPLTADSVVVDCGAYEGNFSLIMVRKYGCKVFAFEPVPEFFRNVVKRLAEFPSVKAANFGVAKEQRMTELRIKGDMTGEFCGEGQAVNVLFVGIVDALKAIGEPVVDLIKFNIEGLEYEVLEAMLDADIVKTCRNIQVQFHTVAPDYEARRDRIRSRLAATHELTWDAPYIWENWSLKK